MFPKLTVRSCWVLWWHGNDANPPWPPLKDLEPTDFALKTARKRYSDIKSLMRRIAVLVEVSVSWWPSNPASLPGERLMTAYETAFDDIPVLPKVREIRRKEWLFTIALREIRQAETRRRQEDEHVRPALPERLSQRSRTE